MRRWESVEAFADPSAPRRRSDRSRRRRDPRRDADGRESAGADRRAPPDEGRALAGAAPRPRGRRRDRHDDPER